MRRSLLLLCIAGAIFATSVGTASAAVQELQFRGPFTVLSANNEPAIQGPRVVFFADFRCTSGQNFGALVVVRQSGAIGAGGATATCEGSEQSAIVGVQKNRGSPNFSLLNATLNVEGVGMTNLTRPPQLNDILYEQGTVSPAPVGDGGLPPLPPLPPLPIPLP